MDLLRIGTIPLGDDRLLAAKWNNFGKALARHIGIQVRIDSARDYDALIQSLESGETCMGWVAPMAAAPHLAQGKLRPIGVAVRGGVTGYSTALFCRQEAAINGPLTMQQLRVGWVDQKSASGHLIMRAHLLQLGVDFSKAFSMELFFGTHHGVVAAVLDGRADVAATFIGLKPGTEEIERAGWITSSWVDPPIRILATAGPIPSDFLAAGPSLSQQLFDSIQAALIDDGESELAKAARRLFSADGFSYAAPAHIRCLQALAGPV